MMLNLSDLSSESLQSQIIDQVRAQILAGTLAGDFSLPSIRALARQQKVSVITVQRAYEELMRQGLIYARRGKGFFVSEMRHERKREMACQRLTRELAPVLATALREGLGEEEIRRAFKRALEKEAA